MQHHKTYKHFLWIGVVAALAIPAVALVFHRLFPPDNPAHAPDSWRGIAVGTLSLAPSFAERPKNDTGAYPFGHHTGDTPGWVKDRSSEPVNSSPAIDRLAGPGYIGVYAKRAFEIPILINSVYKFLMVLLDCQVAHAILNPVAVVEARVGDHP